MQGEARGGRGGGGGGGRGRAAPGCKTSLGRLGLLCLIQPGPGKSRSAVTESLASSLDVWEALPRLLGQPLTSLPVPRVPPKGPRSPGTQFCRDGLLPQAALGSPSPDPAPGAGRGLWDPRIWLSPITDNQGKKWGKEGGKTKLPKYPKPPFRHMRHHGVEKQQEKSTETAGKSPKAPGHPHTLPPALAALPAGYFQPSASPLLLLPIPSRHPALLRSLLHSGIWCVPQLQEIPDALHHVACARIPRPARLPSKGQPCAGQPAPPPSLPSQKRDLLLPLRLPFLLCFFSPSIISNSNPAEHPLSICARG